jgi:antitoxin ParD1/3/4
MVDQREAEDASKLKALRAAARVGLSAFTRGDFREFETIEELHRYLTGLADKVASDAAE